MVYFKTQRSTFRSLCSICLFIVLFSGVYAQSGTIKFQHLALEKGISHNLTYCILQDEAGFMWFGTLFGLVRYDGHRYEVYRNDPFDSTSISEDDIISLFEDRAGNLWIGTYGGGLNLLDRDHNRFIRFQHDAGDSLSISDNAVWAICEDRHGQLWIGTEKGLNRMIRKDHGRAVFRRYQHSESDRNSLLKDYVRTLYKDRSGRLWVGLYEGGLHLYNEEEDAFIRLDEKHSIGSNNIVSIYEDHKSLLWTATWGGGLKQVILHDPDNIRKETVEFITYASNAEMNSISSNNVWSITEDEYDNLWIGTYSGLNHWNRKSGVFTSYTHDFSNPNSLSSNSVSALYRDRSGVFWIGTFRGTIDKFVPAFQKFQHYNHDPHEHNSLSHNEISALYEDRQGMIWIGTLGGGLNRFDPRHKTFVRYTHDPNDPATISSNSILSITGNGEGNLWIGTTNGLNRFDRRKQAFERFIHNPRSTRGMTGSMITALHYNPGNILWMGTARSGLNRFDMNNNVYHNYKHDENNNGSLINDYVTSLYRDSRQRLWIGTFDGLDLASGPDSLMSFRHYLHDPADRNSISHNNIYCILEDRSSRIWIGTSNGLNLYLQEGEQFKQYTTEDGLPNNVICGILEDVEGCLWISTQKGISKFNPEQESFKNFDLSHGLQSNMFNVGACLKRRSGQMLFGGINGLNLFDPEKIQQNQYIPPVHITAFKVFDKTLDYPGAIQQVSRMELSYTQNFFTLEFAALDYHAPEKNRYAYKLEGVDPEWVKSETKNYASYTNLDPGKYTFRVKGSNNDGVWNEQGQSMEIVILPPFWMTWWFKTLGVSVIVFIMSALIYSIRRQAERKTALNKRMAELKLKALRAQMNPHFIFNTINAIQYFINFNDQKSAYNYLSLFSKLLRMTLDNSERSTIPLSEEMMRLKLYLELQLLRLDNKFSYTINVDSAIDQHNIEIPTMIIQPYVENAIQHGIGPMKARGRIDISLTRRDHTLECTIRDNGIGIRKSFLLKHAHRSEHNSTAMRVTEERLGILNAAHKADLNVHVIDLVEEGADQNGTKVIINIPV